MMMTKLRFLVGQDEEKHWRQIGIGGLTCAC